MPESKHKSSSEVAGTAKKHQAPRKDEERQEWKEVPEEPKRFTVQEVASWLSLFEGILVVSKTEDPNIEWYMKVSTVIQKAVQCCHVIYEEEEKSYDPDITGSFSQEGR